MLDILLKNGKIVDGTGSPWFHGDVGIKNGSIVLAGRIHQDALETLDVEGKVICPGFIDSHSHADLAVLDPSTAEIKLRQGVTTEVFGNCGLSPAPVSDIYGDLLERYIEPIIGRKSGHRPWHTIGEFIHELSGEPRAYHTATLVGNGALRIHAKGFDPGPLSSWELQDVLYHLEEGMEAGALGLSLGLMYTPEIFYTVEGLVPICRLLAKYNAPLTVHLRGEGSLLIPSIKEVLSIGEKAGVPLHISHFKAAGRRNWGCALEEAMALLEKTRQQGLDVTCDVYPYHAGSSSFASLLPPWSLEGGIEKALDRLQNSHIRTRVQWELGKEGETWDNLVCSTGWDHVWISSVGKTEHSSWVGKSVAEIASARGQDETECALDIFQEDSGGTGIVFFHMSEEDVKKVMRWNLSSIISDSIYTQRGNPHPRLYGSFPRLFAKYVRDEKVLSLEEAVRKVTSLPARRFGLGKRGLLLEGYTADITVFDPYQINDKATYENPRQYPAGIEHVIVNGHVALRSGMVTGKRGGQFIRRH